MNRLHVFALATLLLAAGTSARAASIGIGAFGGVSAPVLQEDQSQGTLYGVRSLVKLVPLLAVEPFFSTSALGDKTVTVGGFSATRSGADVTSYGANVLLTMGGPVSFYPYAGIGEATFKRTGAKDESFTSYSMGLGLGLSPIPKVSFDLRGELQAAVDGGVSRKMANVTIGVSYAIFSLP